MDHKPEQHSSSPVQEVQKPSKWKRLFGKRWIFPGMYMLAAALIVALMWWYQSSKSANLDEQLGVTEERNITDTGMGLGDDEAMPTGAQAENMIQPVVGDAEITMKFFDESAPDDEKEAALLQYGQTFNPHTGIDYAAAEDETFDVVAALSGTVQSVTSHPLNGMEIVLEHPNGLQTVYQSMGEVKVTEGDEVAQGDVLGTAGRNQVEKDAGVHLHFEVRENGQSVNPENFLSENSSQ